MTIRRVIRGGWDSVLALAAAICAALWLTPTVINSVTTEVIAFFTIQAAVILPAMIFTAGLLRGQGLTIAEVNRYQGALRRQMHFWVTLLFLDLLAVAMLIVGKAADWHWNVTVGGHTAEMASFIIFSVIFTSTLAVLRMIPFVKGVMSLMELNGWLALRSAQTQAASSPESHTPPQAPLHLPEGYGKIIPHSRNRRR